MGDNHLIKERREVMKKKIKNILPGTTPMFLELNRREMEKYKDSETSLVFINVQKGPESIESSFDVAWAVLPTLQEVLKAEKEGYDGVIINCFSDPALRAAKEAVKIPVVGLGEASVTFALLLGHKFGIVAVGPPGGGAFLTERHWDNLRMYGLDHKCVGIKSMGIPVLDLKEGSQDEKRRLIEIGREMIEQGADVLILGCGALLGIAEAASRQLGVPIIIPLAAALKMCEAMISMGVAQSKKGFYSPAVKKRVS